MKTIQSLIQRGSRGSVGRRGARPSLLAVGVSLLALWTVLSAQAASVQEVIDDYVKALGGREAIERLSSVEVKGRWEMPSQGISGVFELKRAKPNRQVMRIELGGMGEIKTGFDGKVAWSQNPFMGSTVLEGAMAAQAAEEADFLSALHDPSRFQSMKNAGIETFDGRECYRLDLVTKSGRELTEYFEVESGLMAGVKAEQVDPTAGGGEITMTFRDYQAFGDLKQATRMGLSSPMADQSIVITEVTYDTVKPEAFALPAEIQAQVK